MADVDDERSESGAAGGEDPEEIDFGDEAENEEGELGAFPMDMDEFIRKLREVPSLPPTESQGCGASASKKSYKDWKFPTAERLTVTTLSKLDLIKQQIPLPKGRIPPLSLPSWHFIPMEKRIPMVQGPPGLLYYTRGKLSKKLHRATVVYSLTDPLNFERVVGGPYNSLHDPHAKLFHYNPLYFRILREQGFVNEQNEVLCSFKEFNKFRDYLRTLYQDEIWKQIGSGVSLVQCERDQLKSILKEEKLAVGMQAKRNERQERAKRFQGEALEYRKKKAQHREQITETRLKQWQMERDRKVLEHIIKGIEDSKRNAERLKTVYEMRLQRRRDIFTKSTRKFLETEERQRNDKAMMEAAYNKFLLEWIESKYVFCYEKLIHQRQLQIDLTGSLKYRARKRQLRLEKYREQLPMMLEKRKAETVRIWAIVRKYAMRWLEKVRARRNAPKDTNHESCWIGNTKSVLDDTLKYLYQESGYEKLDDFILNIMKLKKQIQAQIELEEAEEAALLAAQEGSGGSGSDGAIKSHEFDADST